MDRKRLLVAGIVAVTLASAGCLEKETSHTIYLNPDGNVAWMVLEGNVRSVADDDRSRRSEESEFLSNGLAGSGAIAKGFATLEASRVESRVLRRERPFMVMTEARFSDIEVLASRILTELGLNGAAYTTTQDDTVTLHVHLDLRGEKQGGEIHSPVLGLVDDLSAYRIVLTDGGFTAVEGFELNWDNTVATPIALDEEALKDQLVYDISLSWRR